MLSQFCRPSDDVAVRWEAVKPLLSQSRLSLLLSPSRTERGDSTRWHSVAVPTSSSHRTIRSSTVMLDQRLRLPAIASVVWLEGAPAVRLHREPVWLACPQRPYKPNGVPSCSSLAACRLLRTIRTPEPPQTPAGSHLGTARLLRDGS